MNNSVEYRKRQIIGLLIVAVVILAIALFRAAAHTVFPRGWWRVW